MLEEGIEYASCKEFGKSVKFLTKALKINPDRADVWLKKAKALEYLKKTKDALKCYDKAKEIDPKLVMAWDMKGKFLQQIGAYWGAWKTYLDAIKENPDAIELYYGIGIALERENQFEEALEWFEILMKKYKHIDRDKWDINTYQLLPLNPEYCTKCNYLSSHIAKTCTKCGDYLGTKQLDLNVKNFSLIWLHKGIYFSVQNNYEKAIECFNAAIEVFPENYLAVAKKGDCYALLEKVDEAIKCYEIIIQNTEPRYQKYWIKKISYLKGLEQIPQEIRSEMDALHEKLMGDPNLPPTPQNLANRIANIMVESSLSTKEGKERFQELKKKYDNLPDQFKKLAAIITSIPDPHSGRLLQKYLKFQGDKKKLISLLAELIQFVPDNEFVLSLLESGYMYFNNMPKVAECLEKIVKLKPNDGSAWKRLAGAYSLIGEFNDAIRCFKKAIELNPNDYSLFRGISNVFELENDPENAIKYLKMYVKKVPNDIDAQKNLNDLLRGKSALLDIGKQLEKEKKK